MPTTGWSSCGARRARCCRACSTSAGAARSSRAPSATSWCAPAWPAWSSSTSAIRRCTSDASTASPNRATTPARRPRCGRVLPHRPARRLGPRSRAAGGGLARPRGGALLPCDGPRSAGAGPPPPPLGAGRAVLGLEDEYFVDPDGRPGAVAPGGAGGAQFRDGGERLFRTGWSSAARARCCPRWARRARARWATSSGRSSASRTRSSARHCLAFWSSRWARHREDRGRAAPRRLPALHPPLSAGAPGRPRRRPQPLVPALHRAGPPFSRRDRGQPVDGFGVVPEVRVRGVDDAAAAKLKGDVRMVKVLTRAVGTRERPLRRDVEVPFGAGVLRLRARTTEDIVGMARRRRGPQRPPSFRGVTRPPRVVR